MAAQPKRQRKRIPRLTDAGLNAALAGIDTLNVSEDVRGVLRDIFTAAASTQPVTPDTVLAGMRDERRESVGKVAREVAKQRRGVVRRARRDLEALPDSEWQALVNEANQE